MIDDESLALAQAFERVAQLAARVRFRMFDLDACKSLGGTAAQVAQAKTALAELEAEQEVAVRELAAQLSAWKDTISRE